MKYYILQQPNATPFAVLPTVPQKEFWDNDYDVMTCQTLKDCRNLSFLPFYSRPAWLLSKEMYNIAHHYQLGQVFKPCLMGQKGTKHQRIYYAMQPLELDCLDETTEYASTRILKKMVLNTKKIGVNKLFHPRGILEPFLVADMEMLEKFLCAGIYPIAYEEVECV